MGFIRVSFGVRNTKKNLAEASILCFKVYAPELRGIGLSGYFVGGDNLHDVLEQEIASCGSCGPRIWENPKIRGTLSWGPL